MACDFIQIDCLKLDLSSRKLFVRNRAVVLRNMEFNLLEYFMRHSGVVLSRTRILEDVWDHNIFCSTNTVDVHVSNLRQKLFEINHQNFIRTIHCVGYVFEPF